MSAKQSPLPPIEEQRLMVEMWDPRIADDPLAFVLFAFPWGKKGTPLENFPGPRAWQRRELSGIRDHIIKNKNLIAQGKVPELYRVAISSGRGPGKSALVSWLVLWFLSSRIGATTIVTANTETQLKSRTWAEVGKWHTLAINSHWFEKSAMALKPEQWFQDGLKNEVKIDTGYYYAAAQTWTEEAPDNFAGIHNNYGLLVIFDEASGVPAPIWKVTEGFFTDPTLHRYYFVFSNPRRASGSFFECFHRDRAYWNTRNIDSRTVEGTDKKVLQEIVDRYGEDSDEARVEVKGEFPRQGDRQFISRQDIIDATTRELVVDPHAALMMGVDIARFGSDSTVIRFRQGRNARIIPPIKMKGKDNMEVANTIAHLIDTHGPDAVCIDAGNGTGVIDRLREMKYHVYEVWFGSKSEDQEWSNKRTEMWAKMREWLKGGVIDNDPDLLDDLSSPEYKFQGSSDKIMLESKEDMRKKGFSSPDNGDALACTFAVKVARKDNKLSRGGIFKSGRVAKGVDYNLFGD
jgi:hypothetical protein